MAGKRVHAAVVGASTLLGKELVQEIGESAATVWDLRLLENSEDAEGQLTAAGDEALVVHALTDSSFQGLDVLFFAGAREVAAEYGDAAVRSGAAIVDLTGAFAGREGFVVRSPWMEKGARPDLTTVGVVAPHPAALMLGVVVSRLAQHFEVSSVVASMLEPASEAGSAGVDELHQQTVNLLSFQEVPKKVYGTQVAFNVQATLGEEAAVPLAETRGRIRSDAKALLDGNFRGALQVNLLQAPVFHGYVASVYLSLGKAASADLLRAALGGGVVVCDAETQPSNQAAIESGDLLVSVEAQENGGQGHWLVLAADNLRLSARNGVAAALELLALRPAARVQ